LAAGLAICLALLTPRCSKQAGNVMDGFVDVNGASFYYKAIGEGEPVLVLHGGPGLEHRYLLPRLPRISDKHRFIFFDQRSCGKTESPFDSSRMTIPQFVEDIEALRKALKLGEMNLMGHSWGGLLALFYAIQYPDHLKSLILISTAGASSEYLEPFVKNIRKNRTAEDRAEMKRLESAAGFEKNPGLVEQWYNIYFHPYFFDKKKADSLVVKLTRQSIDVDAHGYLFRGLETYNIHNRLDSVRVPALIVHGKQDPLPAWCSERIHVHLPNSRLCLIDRCGHFPYIERPDTLAAIFRRFMKSL
jgi:proline iminopeptidase